MGRTPTFCSDTEVLQACIQIWLIALGHFKATADLKTHPVSNPAATALSIPAIICRLLAWEDGMLGNVMLLKGSRDVVKSPVEEGIHVRTKLSPLPAIRTYMQRNASLSAQILKGILVSSSSWNTTMPEALTKYQQLQTGTFWGCWKYPVPVIKEDSSRSCPAGNTPRQLQSLQPPLCLSESNPCFEKLSTAQQIPPFSWKQDTGHLYSLHMSKGQPWPVRSYSEFVLVPSTASRGCAASCRQGLKWRLPAGHQGCYPSNPSAQLPKNSHTWGILKRMYRVHISQPGSLA